MRNILQKLLRFFARKIIQKYHPRIIGITGSVGKTSAKEAIFQVVSQKYRTYRPDKNLNNEYGLPLAIIGVDSPGRSVWGWIKVFIRAKLLWLLPRTYPEVVVLEYGIDRPGDMEYLLSIVRPDIAVITNIGISHYEFFQDTEAIETEKGKLVAGVDKAGLVILNADNSQAIRQKEKSAAKVMTYGTKSPADVFTGSINETINGRAHTMLEIRTPDGVLEIVINAVGLPHVHSCLAAVTVGTVMGIEHSLIAQGLKQYKPAPGRLNVIAGIKQSTVIDDSYNASPDSTKEALKLLSTLPANYKVAVLGDMRELGSLSDEAHNEIGTIVAGLGVHRLVTVGVQGKRIAEAAIAAGFPESKVSSWDNSDVAKKVVQGLMEPQSLVLVKGSQFVRMEKITKEIMAEPMRAEELLCRQYGNWLNS